MFLCKKITENLIAKGCAVQGVPGFYQDRNGNWTVNFTKRLSGILLPVVGFDGLSIGEYTVPRLSTVSQSVEQLAEQSMHLLRRSIEDGAPAEHRIVPVNLLLKESARKL